MNGADRQRTSVEAKSPGPRCREFLRPEDIGSDFVKITWISAPLTPRRLLPLAVPCPPRIANSNPVWAVEEAGHYVNGVDGGARVGTLAGAGYSTAGRVGGVRQHVHGRFRDWKDGPVREGGGGTDPRAGRACRLRGGEGGRGRTLPHGPMLHRCVCRTGAEASSHRRVYRSHGSSRAPFPPEPPSTKRPPEGSSVHEASLRVPRRTCNGSLADPILHTFAISRLHNGGEVRSAIDASNTKRDAVQSCSSLSILFAKAARSRTFKVRDQ